MTTDRELLELAAKAFGYTKRVVELGLWNPHEDDGDSRVLQVQLKITLECNDFSAVASYAGFVVHEMYGNAPAAAARLAVLKVAAEIGRNME